MGSPLSIPMVEVRLRSMEHSIVHAFMEHSRDMGEMVEEAVKRVCTPEYVARLLDEQTSSAISSAVEGQVRSFFQYGAGSAVIKRAVAERLMKDIQNGVNDE
jgi:hypothetical protein